MVLAFSCLYCVLASNWTAAVEVVLRYLLFVTVAGVFLIGVHLKYNLEELDYELRGFVRNYKETSWWWLTSFFASFIALTVGSESGWSLNLAILSIFFAPAMLYFYRNYPFSLRCDYRSRGSDGKSVISEEQENIATKTDGVYILEFPITTGENIDNFIIDMAIPSGVKIRNYSAIQGVEIPDNESVIEGTAPPGRDSFVVELILDETDGVQPGSNLLVLSDNNSGRELNTIRLIP